MTRHAGHRADEFEWRQAKDSSGLYVHRPEEHVYPGPTGWDATCCAENRHERCRAAQERQGKVPQAHSGVPK